MIYFALHCAVIPARVAVRASAFPSREWIYGIMAANSCFNIVHLGLAKLGAQLKHSINLELTIFNRPGVAGGVLQRPLSLIH